MGDAPAKLMRRDAWLRWARVIGRDLGMVVATLGAIVVSVRETNPIFANQQPAVARLLKAPAKPIFAPPPQPPADTGKLAQLMASPQFAKDSAAFAADLVNTGHMAAARADSVAYYAVREAYLDGVPPAVVFGVMLTENSTFVSRAQSNVGAVGLMQVYPKVWLKALSAKFGANLSTDSTNLKYGIYILSHYIKSDSGSVTPKAANTGLLAYNGCVKGTNTPNCHTYPGKVQQYVDKAANALCGNKTFYDCIAKPFMTGLFGKPPAPSTIVAQTQ